MRTWIAPLAASVLVGSAMLSGASRHVSAQGQTANLSVPLRISAWAVNMSNISTGTNAVMDINITRKKNTIELENFASEPVRLQNVALETK